MRRVGIAGAGGMGSNCAAHLVRAGMKKLVIADFDVVNESNLNRQFFFRNQLGQKKVVALGRNLRLIEPALDLTLHGCLRTLRVRLSPNLPSEMLRISSAHFENGCGGHSRPSRFNP